MSDLIKKAKSIVNGDGYNHKSITKCLADLIDQIADKDKELETVKKQRDGLANFNPDWDMLEAARDSLREHMAICGELKAQIEAKDKEIKDSECLWVENKNTIDSLKARNESLEKVAKAVNKFRWPEARISGSVWEELYRAMQALKELK